ncbi:substrate-binding domain-containing protein [Paenibacillus sp. P26]|nr:substrate-binding domain-containing protein [Paenibacillus sp. P26]
MSSSSSLRSRRRERAMAALCGSLQREDRPDGIFCFNDGIAKGAFNAAENIGLRVGEDLGLVGCDNTNICEMLQVKLTSVRFQTYETGKQAAQALLEGEGQENRTQVLRAGADCQGKHEEERKIAAKGVGSHARCFQLDRCFS